MINNEEEIWKSHSDFEKLEVSTLGRVRTLDKVVPTGKRAQFIRGRVLKQSENGGGYMQVSVKVDGKWVNKLVHRLVAQTFLPNPNGFPMINHKDCNIKNNNVENLEFCTASYNSKYREKFGKALSKPVFAIKMATLEVSYFRSQSEASRELEILQPSINMVIKGKRNQTGGYWFVNADDNAVDVVKSKLHDIGGTGLKIKHRSVN